MFREMKKVENGWPMQRNVGNLREKSLCGLALREQERAWRLIEVCYTPVHTKEGLVRSSEALEEAFKSPVSPGNASSWQVYHLHSVSGWARPSRSMLSVLTWLWVSEHSSCGP